MGGQVFRVGRNPPKSLEFKNLQGPVSSPLLPPLQLTVLLFSLLPLSLPLPPARSPSPSLWEFPAPCASELECTALSLFAFRESLSVILLLETQSSLTEIIAKGRDRRG